MPQSLIEQDLAVDRHSAFVLSANLHTHVIPGAVRIRELAAADGVFVDIELEVVVPRSAEIDAQALLAGPDANRATLVDPTHATDVEVDRIVDPCGVSGIQECVRLLHVRELGPQDAVVDTPR